MNSKELKQYIVDNKKIELILEDLGCNQIKFQSKTNSWTATQPDGDNPQGVVIRNNYYLGYYSYSREVHSDDQKDLLYLVKEIKKFKGFKETMEYIHGLLGLEYTFDKSKISKDKKVDPLAIFKKAAAKSTYKPSIEFNHLDEDILEEFVPMIHIDLFREGIIKKTIDKFKLGYSYKWKRTIFPVRYWADGSLMGFNARTSIPNHEEFGITKYFITPGMRKEINLYGLYENKKSIEETGYVIITESEKSVLKLDSRNKPHGVALSGKNISKEQIRIIMGLEINEVIICLDKDVPMEEVWDMCENFYHKRKVSYIVDRWSLLNEKDSPCDKSINIFDFMFKHRVKYDENTHQKYSRKINQ